MSKTKMLKRLGETNVANNGLQMTIIAYRGSNDIDIKFEDGAIVYHKTYHSFHMGTIGHPDINSRQKHINRIGEINTSNSGYKMTIVEYNNAKDIMVEFEDGTKVHTQYSSFKNGNVKHPNIKSKRTKKHYIGEEFVNRGGYKFKIINIQEDNQYDVQYENGIIKEKVQLNNEKNRKNCP